MIRHVLNSCSELSPTHVVVVVGPNAKQITDAVAPNPCAVQQQPLGTGDAVKAARKELENFKGDIVVLYADSPLMTPDSLRRMQNRRRETGATVVVAGFTPENPAAYGRLILDKTGKLSEIVEASEATPEQAAVNLCNGGVMLFDGAKLWPLIDQLRDNNAQKRIFPHRLYRSGKTRGRFQHCRDDRRR